MPRSDSSRRSDSAETAIRGLGILEVLAGMEQPAGLAAITERCGLSQNQCFRALRALQEQGYVDHLARKGYRLGTRSVALAFLLGPRPTVLRAAQPIMRRLVATTSESAALHLRSGDHRVLVMRVQGPRESFQEVVQLGERAPLTSGASGTPILAHLPAGERMTLINNRPSREHRPTERGLAHIRDVGYAISFSANHAALSGIGAAILDPNTDYPLGSIAMAAPASRISEDDLHQLGAPLIAACTALAPRLAKLLGPGAIERLESLDVTVQGLVGI